MQKRVISYKKALTYIVKYNDVCVEFIYIETIAFLRFPHKIYIFFIYDVI